MIKFNLIKTRSRKPLFIALCVLALILPAIIIYSIFARRTSAAWYNESWLYRKQLVFENSASATNLTDFPALVVLDASNFKFNQTQSAGQDLRFTDSDGTTLLSYEIESYDSTNKTARIWVKVPQINSASSSDSIYLYWGNNVATDSQSADNTWKTEYKGIYHLNDNAASTTVTDSSGNTNNITSYVNTSANLYQSASQIAGGIITGGTPTYITDQTGANNSELHPDIALDSSGFPVIAYYDGTNGDLVVVHCNDKECKGGDESVNIVDATNSTGNYPSILLDSNGYPMIAYQYVNGLDLYYVHCNDVNCAGNDETFTTIETTNNVGFYTRMVLDASGYPVITHYSSTSTDLRIYHCSNADCTSGTANIVDSTGTVGNNKHGTDIVLNASGYPVMSYYDTTNTELKVAVCSDANCATVTTRSPLSTLGLNLGFYTSLELDASGFPMIAYYNTTNTDLDFLHCDDVLCDGVENANRIILDTTNATFPSLEKDSSGLPVVIATNNSGQYPNVYRCTTTSCASSTSTKLAEYDQYGTDGINFRMDASNNIYAVGQSRGKTGMDDSLFFNTTHKLERAYDADFNFGTASFSVSTWFKTNGLVQDDFLLSRYDADQGFKLRLDSAGRPCFEIDDDATWNPDDSACSSDPQVMTNVDNGNAGAPTFNDVVLDSSGFPVIAYFDGSGNDLEIIHCNDVNCTGNNENYANIDVTNNVGSYMSMVLDATGYPVIAYQDLTSADLRIIHCGNANCSAGNVARTVDSGGSVGIYPSLKLDSSGYPVVAYTDTTNTSVKLMHCNDATCDPAVNGAESFETVSNVSSDQTRSNQALLLDSSGYPMIVFADLTSGDLEYVHCNDANCNGGNETLVTIETTNIVGEFAAMVKDGSGFPVIAFTDTTNSVLRVIHCGNADCNSGNTANALTTINSGDFGYTEIDIQLNSSGYPVILSRQLPSYGQILTVCNDVNCSGDNESHSLIRDDRYMTHYHGLALDSSGYPVISYTSTNADVRLIHMTNGTTFTPQGNYDDSAWHHMVGVKNGTTSLTLYIDGVAVATDSAIAATATLTSNSATLNLAEEITSTHSVKNWSGYMDEVQLDTTARTSDWVKAQYLNESNTFINQGANESHFGSNLGVFTNNTGALQNNLVAHYKFDEGYGTTARNSGSAGSSHSGTISNAIWTKDGKYDHALTYNGTSSYTQLGTTDLDTYFEALDNWSFSTWVNISSWTSEGAVFSNRYADTEFIRLLTNGTTGQLGLGTRDSGNTTINQLITGLSANTWYHIAISRTYNGSIDIYVNGVLKSSAADTRTGDFVSEAGSHEYFVGRTIASADWVTWKYFTGRIDDTKIYNDALSADEVKQDYNKGSAIQLGSFSDTSLLTGGSVASNSASALYCVPGGTDSCNPPFAYWDFEEASWTNNCSTGTLLDKSTGGYNLNSCPNGTGLSLGTVSKFGQGAQLDGVNDYFETSSTAFSLSGAISIEAWVKPTATSVNDDYVINRTNGNAGYSLGWASAMQPKLIIGNGTAYTNLIATTVMALNTWYHLTATVDASGNGKIYVNGVLENSASVGILAGTTQNLKIGTRSSGNEVAAIVDEVKIFTYVRTPSQVAWNYNQGKPQGHWKLDECTGTIIHDSIGSIANGTIIPGASGNTSAGTCSSGTSTEMWNDGTIGKYNGSLGFDGLDDAVTIPADSRLYLTTGGTVTAWIKPSSTGENSFGRIVDKSSDTSGTGGYVLGMNGNAVYGEMTNGTNTSCSSLAGSVPFSAWSHVAWVFNGVDWKFYVNGKLSDSCTTTKLPSATALGLTIGNRQGATDRTFEGLIDEVAIFNYTLTPTQIEMVFNEGSSVRFGP